MTFILKNEPAFLAPAAGVNGLRMLGIVHEAVVFLLEQLYGSRHCRSYCFRFHKPEESDEPPINPHGSARAEISHRLGVGIVGPPPFAVLLPLGGAALHLTAVFTVPLPSRRSVFDMFNFLASKHRQPPQYRPLEDDDDEGQLRTARSVFFFAAATSRYLLRLSKVGLFLKRKGFLVTFPFHAAFVGAPPWSCRWL